MTDFTTIILRLAQIAQEFEAESRPDDAALLDDAVSDLAPQNMGASSETLLDEFTISILQQVCRENRLTPSELLSDKGQAILATEMSETLGEAAQETDATTDPTQASTSPIASGLSNT